MERSSNTRTESVGPFIILALVLSWVPALAAAVGDHWAPIPREDLRLSILFWTAAAGPALAMILIRLVSRRGPLWRFRLDLPLKWILISIGLPMLWIAAVVVLGRETGLSGWPGPRETPSAAVLSGMRWTLFPGLPLAILQETAWRGYMLPLVLERGRIEASLLVGLVWAACTAPLLILTRPFQDVSHAVGFPAFFLHVIALSCLLTWVYCGSRRSAIACLLSNMILWSFAEEMTRWGRLDGTLILVSARGIMGTMFLVLWAWWLYHRGQFRN